MGIIEDINQQRRLDLETCKLVSKYSHLLNDNMQEPFAKFYNLLRRRVSLTPAQHNYLDGMYECVMGKLTGEKVNVHVDLKNKSKQNLKY
jgi:hypothetical protein